MANDNFSDRERWRPQDGERESEERSGYDPGHYGNEFSQGWSGGQPRRSGPGQQYGQQGRFEEESRWHRQGQGGFGQQGESGYGRGYRQQGQDFGTGGFGSGGAGYGQGGWDRSGGAMGSGYMSGGYGEGRGYGGRPESGFGPGFSESAYSAAQRRSHAGRGPKGYQRSDDRIREDVCETFTRDDELDASDIEIRVEKGEITLTGTVESREAKRLAEDLAERCSGVKEIHNQLRVARPQQAEGGSGRLPKGGSGAGTSS